MHICRGNIYATFLSAAAKSTAKMSDIKICFLLGVSKHEFVLWTISAYELPENVVEIHEVFMDTVLNLRTQKRIKYSFNKQENQAILTMMNCQDPDWDIIFDCYNNKKKNSVEFFRSNQFLGLLKKICINKYPYVSFSKLFFTLRSMFLPVIYIISQPVPEADIYHSAASGYGGILGALAKWKTNKPFILAEHGIYTREREEEILRSTWIITNFKEMWTEMFYMLSRCAYSWADIVTSLFQRASLIQLEIGCKPEKCIIICNGIHYEHFINLPEKEPDSWVDIGAFVRFAPIKDIKTMIYAFYKLKKRVPNTRLHILGGIDDAEYYNECVELINRLQVKDILIPGNVDVKQYMQKLDFTVLTSISEGQPLAVIEFLASGRPVVCTDVGCCRELIYGIGDNHGQAGIVCTPMDYIGLARAMMRLALNPELRLSFGKAGRKRLDVMLEWANDGIAPMYYNWEAFLYIINEDGNPVKKQKIEIDLTKLLPDVPITTKTAVDISGLNLRKNKYNIGLAIIDPITNKPGIAFAMKNERNDRIYIIGELYKQVEK
jgi:glycosyltransferase involved in cell wall biosynthesis